ncbi:MAG: type II and III secretion system protein family protein [Alphaproteobacteria bacterium]|nr:type II and III secretion system protein family protein [Alphaproteobacteria bacterium]
MKRPSPATRALAAALAVATGVTPIAASAQSVAPRVDSGGQSAASRNIVLGLGKAAVIDLPADARDVLLSDPNVADAIVRTARRAYLIGRKIGQTNVFFFDANGRQIGNFEVRVEPDVRALSDLIRQATPSARVKVQAVNGSIVLSGTARSAAESDRIGQIATRFIANDPGTGAPAGQASSPIVNLLTVESEEQVLVKVRVVEMSRSLVKQLGVNLNAEDMLNQLLPDDTFVKVATANGFAVSGRALGGLSASGGTADTVLQPQSLSFPGSNAYNAPPTAAGVGGYALDYVEGPVAGVRVPQETFGPGRTLTNRKVDASIEAFERVGLLRVLAEPNLTAVSGEAAKFLAGGEFPIPVAAEDGKLTIEFKPFGVGLAFTPVVLSPGRISLKMATEVSEITSEGSIVTNGISVPSLQVRRAETTVEMPSGSALVMAGLIQERTRHVLEGTPGAKDLPVLGTLFRSRDFVNNETELVIIVTPYLVKATSPDKIRTPADGFANPDDLSANFRGRLNQVYKNPAADVGDRRLLGPLGFLLPERAPPSTPASAGDKLTLAAPPPRPTSGSSRP